MDPPRAEKPGGEREGERDPAPMSAGTTSPGSYAALGLQFVVAILLFLYAGQWLDRELGTAPWLLILGVFLGASAGFYNMYRRLMADQRHEESRGTRGGSGGPRAGSPSTRGKSPSPRAESRDR